MKRVLAGAALLALAATAQAQPRPAEGGRAPSGPMRGYANPSAGIAAEIAFSRLAQEKGQWTAFRATAAPDAVMFTPAMVLAQIWLNDRADPPVPLAWQPHQVWSSCDGSLMVTTGAWQRADKGAAKHGWFTTVWQRQEKGGYKWVLDHGDETREPLAAPDMISARVATCPDRRAGPRPSADARGKPGKQPPPPPPPPFDPARREGRSNDGTLTWRVTVEPDGARHFTAEMMVDGQMQNIRGERVGAAGT